ncbi:MAG: hypothetical protein F6K30_01195 [Cyanothece sp. SIO2G6]|nr:hypothetical protein [Cyanothece sp. SIO2G6]
MVEDATAILWQHQRTGRFILATSVMEAADLSAINALTTDKQHPVDRQTYG